MRKQVLTIGAEVAYGSGPRDASAREAATIVAVAPTLEARSQESSAVRAMGSIPTSL